MTEANGNTSSLTKQRQKIVIQWQTANGNSNTSSLTKQRQKQWQKLIIPLVIPLVLQNKDKTKNNDRS